MLEKFQREHSIKSDRFYNFVICPVCGCLALDGYYVCDICGWEFDGTLMDKEKSLANRRMSIRGYRKNFLKSCSKEIKSSYKELKRRINNTYRPFDFEFIVYNPGLYRDFYKEEFIDDDTKQFLNKYLNIIE